MNSGNTLRWGHGGAGRGFSLIELLCVMAIITILASLLLGAVGRTYSRVKRFAGEMDSQAHVDELRIKLARFVEQNPDYPVLSLEDLVQRCSLSSRCERFLRSKEVTFRPFGSRTAPTDPVLIFNAGKSGTFAWTKEAICTPPEYAN